MYQHTPPWQDLSTEITVSLDAGGVFRYTEYTVALKGRPAQKRLFSKQRFLFHARLKPCRMSEGIPSQGVCCFFMKGQMYGTL